MPVVTSTPTTVTFNQDDRILYTGSCSLQISFIKEGGGLSPVKVLSQDQWFTLPAKGDYQLTTVGACCNDGTYEVVSGQTPDYEALTVCDTDTGTLWVRWFAIEGDSVRPITEWEDTERSCAEPVITSQDFCVKP